MAEIGIAGAGFSGAVVARELAEAGHRVTVFDTRSHVAGNCFTERDADTGVLLHTYGPHIFHTQYDHVWEYICRFGEMRPYNHRVKATARGSVYSLPINLHTINQHFGTTMAPPEARSFLASLADDTIRSPVSFEDQALAFVGRELYETFFAGYTRKQWGLDPTDLPASILQRLPVRFNYDDSYFTHPYQAIPARGYTAIVEAILDDPRVEVRLDTALQANDVAAFEALGTTDGARLAAWVGAQLAPGSIPDTDCEQHIAGSGYTTLGKTFDQLWQDHFVADPDWSERIRPATHTELATWTRAL